MLSSAFAKLSIASELSVAGLKCAIPALSTTNTLLQCHERAGKPILNNEVSVRFKYVEKKTMSRRFPGHIDVYGKDGERQVLYPAVERYKRLDWGMFITTKRSRFNKCWQRTKLVNLRKQQHGFMDEESCLKLERMFNHELKLPRFVPDDPYEKYNRMPWWKHHWNILKNKKLIEKYGNKDHVRTRYVAHIRFRGEPVHLKPTHYMPPDYLTVISRNPQNRYGPDPETQPPTNEVTPYFQRKRQLFSKVAKRMEHLKKVRQMEKHAKNPVPVWSPILNPWSYPN